MSLYRITYTDKTGGRILSEMNKKPIFPADVRNRLDRISADIEQSTKKGLTAAARDLGNAPPQPAPLLTYISSARTALGVGQLEAAQD
jgi:hypothetical protein